MEDWLREIPNEDLTRVHHAARMMTTHPLTTEPEKLEELANRCWDAFVGRLDSARVSTLAEQLEAFQAQAHEFVGILSSEPAIARFLRWIRQQ